MNNRRWGLDLLRAVAILVVIEQHGRFISEKLGLKLSAIGVTDGVDLFFVLSGFLIGSILIKDYQQHQSLDIKRFWMRRWLRTLPVYLVALVVNIIFILFIFKTEFSKKDMVLHFAFLQNIIPPYTDFRFFSEAWSLSIEEFFYLSLPLLILGISFLTKNKSTNRVILYSLLSLVIFSMVNRAILYCQLPAENYSLNEWNERFRIIVPTRLDSLAIGVLAALIRIRYSDLWNSKQFKWFSFIIGFLLLIVFDRTQLFTNRIPLGFFSFVLYFFYYSVAVAMTLPFLDSWQPRENVATKFVVLVSKLSYSMYLFHNSLMAIPFKGYAKTLPNEYLRVGLYLVYWLGVFVISYITYSFIEKPVLAYRDRKFS